MARKKILFVAMAQSVHTARWISQLAEQDWDLHLFPSSDEKAYPELRDVVLHDTIYRKTPDYNLNVTHKGWAIRSPFFAQELFTLSKLVLGRFSSVEQRAKRLAKLIERLKPDIVHTLELSSSGEVSLLALNMLQGEWPIWIINHWGDELPFFSRLAAYADKIKAVVRTADYFTSECGRDFKLAEAVGFKGKFWPIIPAAGGFDIPHLQTLRQAGPISERKLILLKGYQNFRGRALFGLRAIELCADLLEGYRVCVYSAYTEDVKVSVELMAQKGIPIEIIPRLPHNDDILRIFGQSRIYMGLSLADGASTSMLQSMVMGAFPIQSNTACADEWIKDGETGLIVHPEDVEGIAAALRRALTDDALVNGAALENAKVAEARLDYATVKHQVVDLYREILDEPAS